MPDYYLTVTRHRYLNTFFASIREVGNAELIFACAHNHRSRSHALDCAEREAENRGIVVIR